MSEPKAPPQLSPDGRFCLEGGQWVPMPGVATATAAQSHGKGPGIVILIGAALLALGSLLPWARVTGPLIGTIAKSGIQGDGLFLLIIAVVVGLIGGVLVARPAGAAVKVIALLLAVVAFFVVGSDMSNVQGFVTSTNAGPTFVAEIGEGLYVAALGAALAVIGAIVALRQTSVAAP